MLAEQEHFDGPGSAMTGPTGSHLKAATGRSLIRCKESKGRFSCARRLGCATDRCRAGLHRLRQPLHRLPNVAQGSAKRHWTTPVPRCWPAPPKREMPTQRRRVGSAACSFGFPTIGLLPTFHATAIGGASECPLSQNEKFGSGSKVTIQVLG